MARSKKTKHDRRRRPPRPVLTRAKLREGLSGPAQTRIRLARPEESSQVAELLLAADANVEAGQLDALAAGRCSEWLLQSLSTGTRELVAPLAQAASEERLQDAADALTLPLVAQARDGELLGALLALPPGTLVRSVSETGYEPHALLAMLKYAKIKAIAVSPDARGQGLGAALLKRCMQVYWQVDYILLYGQFASERGLGPVLRPPRLHRAGTRRDDRHRVRTDRHVVGTGHRADRATLRTLEQGLTAVPLCASTSRLRRPPRITVAPF